VRRHTCAYKGFSCLHQVPAAPCPLVSFFLQIGAAAMPSLNILLFLIDDMGYSDLAAFGSPNVSTPHVDKLVSQGMKFTQWISAAPICTPSRAAFQTGRYPIRTGCMANTNSHRVIPTPSSPGGLDPAKHVSLATALRSAGYRTGMSGKVRCGSEALMLCEHVCLHAARRTPHAARRTPHAPHDD
jgi:arylsulfatase A-like enzyme